MKASNNTGTYVAIILNDVPKGDQNRSPTTDQAQVEWPSYGIDECTKKFCVSKKWFNLCPLNMYHKSDLTSTQWSNHLKRLYHRREISIKPWRWKKIVFVFSTCTMPIDMVPRSLLTLTLNFTRRSICPTTSGKSKKKRNKNKVERNKFGPRKRLW